MLKSSIVWTLLTGAALAAGSGEYSAITTSDAALRAAPNMQAFQVGIVPGGTIVTATICFYEGAYCYVTAPGVDGYVAGDLLTINGDTNSVLTAEKARWALLHKNSVATSVMVSDPPTIVVWGDSLSNETFGDELEHLLPGRRVSMQGVPGEDGGQISERMLAATQFDDSLKIIWDRHYSNEAPALYLSDLAPMIEKARETGDFLIISDIRTQRATETVSLAADEALTNEINGELAKLYGKNFVDVTGALEDPSTRGPDGLHLSQLGYDRVASALAKAVANNGMQP